MSESRYKTDRIGVCFQCGRALLAGHHCEQQLPKLDPTPAPAAEPVDKTANPQGSPVDKSPKSQGEPRDDASYATNYAPTPAPEQCCKGLAPMNECNKSCGGNKPDPTPVPMEGHLCPQDGRQKAWPALVCSQCMGREYKRETPTPAPDDLVAKLLTPIQCKTFANNEWQCLTIDQALSISKQRKQAAARIVEQDKRIAELELSGRFVAKHLASALQHGREIEADHRRIYEAEAEQLTRPYRQRAERAESRLAEATKVIAELEQLEVAATVNMELFRDAGISAEARLAEETAIVDRIWDTFGRPSYDALNGRSIYDLIRDQQSRLAEATKVIAELVKWRGLTDAQMLAWNDAEYVEHTRISGEIVECEDAAWQAARAFIEGEK